MGRASRWHSALSLINLALLLGLGFLCLTQWRDELRVSQILEKLQRTTETQGDELRVQAEALDRTRADLDEFRERVAGLQSEVEARDATIREDRAKLFKSEQERSQIAKQAEVLEVSLENYRQALSQRDADVQTLLSQREELLASQRNAVEKANEVILSFNDLNGRYGELVGKYNELVTAYQVLSEAAAEGESK